jgi:hypothetical protein
MRGRDDETEALADTLFVEFPDQLCGVSPTIGSTI